MKKSRIITIILIAIIILASIASIYFYNKNGIKSKASNKRCINLPNG